ncbi:MAG TPA: PQQ-binding-like beta-propeller repeat protein, partial [Calditrichia bacterium]|nr:PQQ-binding-like beta-propeller repeat protein [Calditrichia bacterium]
MENKGLSGAAGLIDSWTPGGQNMIWRQDFIGRSTPVVFNGRVFVIGRTGAQQSMQEVVACFDAQSGKALWRYAYNLRNTTIPFNRVGWASVTVDPESGNVYAIGTGGMFHCFDRDGKILWKYNMVEDFGARTGYGGRTTTPVIDQERVIIGFVSSGWGAEKPMTHRHFAFDKRTGEHIFTATPGRGFNAPNIYTMPDIAVIDGQRLMISGNANGNIYAMKAKTGEPVWNFHLSKRGINVSVLVDGDRVYAAHSEENIDEATMGRIVCFRGTGSGDITKTNEVWRYPATVGSTTPMLYEGRIYFIDNAANLICLDALSGEKKWTYSLGTVGKGSPVMADGKIYVTETNGRFHILQPMDTTCISLDMDEVKMPDGRHAEIYGSPAIAYGRIYFASEEGVYCLGDPSRSFSVVPATLSRPAEMSAGAVPAYLQVRPGETVARSGDQVAFKALAYDEKGRLIGEVKPQWSLKGLAGQIDGEGSLTLSAADKSSAGMVTATVGELSGAARLRVFPQLPWNVDFSGFNDGENPAAWIGIGSARSPGGKYIVKTLEDGEKVLSKPPAERGIQRHFAFIGPSDMKGYAIQADVMGTQDKRRKPDIGIIASGYTLDMMGKTQKLELRSWVAEYRVKETIDF